MSRAFRDAVGETQGQYDALLTHLSLIRDLVALGHTAPSLERLYAETAACVVRELGYEDVFVIAARDAGTLEVAGSYSQGRRFDGAVEHCPAILTTLARDVMAEGTLLRWGGEGVGARRPLPAELDGSVVGFPLVVSGETAGAVMCTQLVPVVWDVASQRALEIVGGIIGQVASVTQARLTVAGVQRGLEAEIGATRSQLSEQARTLGSKSREVAELTEALINSNRAKQTFLALMSHELRTPLSVILGFGSLLRDRTAGPLTPQQEDYLARMFASGRHLSQLIEDMLFFVDAETTQIQPAVTAVDLPALLEEVMQSVPSISASDAPAFTTAIAPEASMLRTDPILLRRVLFHLIGNAFKFTEHGEVRVESARTPDGTATCIRIVDSGVGIPEPQRSRVLQLFAQGDDTPARKHDGLGLGLNLVHTCLGLLGGSCRLTSSAAGTEVEVELPDEPQLRGTVPAPDAAEGIAAAVNDRAGSAHG